MWRIFPDIIGLIGVALIAIAYIQIQTQKKQQDTAPLSYSVMNLCGSAMLLFSLCFNWNLAAVIIQLIWISISLFGIWRWRQYRSFIKKEK